LTKKQKDEQRAAEIRKQALLASGVVIEGLQQQQAGGSGGAPKKFSYGSKKKKAHQAGTSTKESTPISTPSLTTKALSPEPEPEPPTPEEKPTDVKDDWDAESEQEKPETAPTPAADVKSDWDDSSEDEKPAPKPTAQPKGVFPFALGPLYLTTLGQPHRNRPPRQQRLGRSPSHRRRNPLRLLRKLPRSLQNSNPNPKRTLMTTPMTILTKTPMKVSPRHSRWLLRRRPRQLRGEPRPVKLPLLPGVRMICGAPFAVFSGTSIPERRSFWIRSVATDEPSCCRGSIH
jgi:hypothetical protein